MKALARAIINAVAYLDLSSEEGLSEETALQCLDEISYNLSYCNNEERQALAEVLNEMREAEIEQGPRIEVLEFLDSFLSSLSEEEPPEEDEDFDAKQRINLL